MTEQVYECQASIAGGLPCLAPVEFNCREFGAVCLTHSHVRGCCQPVFYDEEGDVWAADFGFRCIVDGNRIVTVATDQEPS